MKTSRLHEHCLAYNSATIYCSTTISQYCHCSWYFQANFSFAVSPIHFASEFSCSFHQKSPITICMATVAIITLKPATLANNTQAKLVSFHARTIRASENYTHSHALDVLNDDCAMVKVSTNSPELTEHKAIRIDCCHCA